MLFRDPELPGLSAEGFCESTESPRLWIQEETVIFDMAQPGFARLSLHDVTGRTVRTLLARHITAGRHAVAFEDLNTRSSTLPPGVYFVRLLAGDRATALKVLLMR